MTQIVGTNATPAPVAPPSPGHRKVTAGMIGGAVAALVVWYLSATQSLDVPPGVESAIGTLVTAALVYLVPEARR